MATYEAISSAAADTGGGGDAFPLSIPKPSGLTEGEYMLAGIFADGSNTGVSITTPSGWTLVESVSPGDNDRVMSVFSKLADSSDVAASNFSFTGDVGDTEQVIGHIVRISSFGLVAGDTAQLNDASSSTHTVTGFTPTRENCLFVAFNGTATSTSTIISVNSVAMATSNPTWTERAETSRSAVTSTRDISFAVATATRTEDTATGNFTITTDSGNDQEVYTVILAIGPQQNGSITQETKVNAYAFSPINETEIDAIVEDPTLSSMNVTEWTNESETTTTWTNEQK